ncbi:MAG: O-antigen ligase family protein [Candidatus Omnitrophica bacterium]|nr:O-antigen ligase family protein [Candidatus Omnitrophota bacterium]
MKVNTLYLNLGLVTVFGIALSIAILITPLNFLVLQIMFLAALFFFYLLFKDITTFIMIWFLSLLFIMFTKFPLGIDVPNLSPDRMLWFLLIVCYVFHALTGRISLSNRTIEIFMLILCTLAIFSIIRMKGVSLSRDILDTYSKLFNAYVVPFSIFFIAKDFINEEYNIRKLFSFLSVVLLYLSLTAIFEHFRLVDFIFPRGIMNPGLGIHFGRARGPFLQAAVNGSVLGMLSATNLYMAMNTRFPYRLFFIVIACLSPVAIFLTYTRASWLAFILCCTFMLFVNRRFRKYIGILILLGLVLFIPLHSKILDMERFSARVYSENPINDRINLYHTYIAMFKDKPFLGFGFANFTYHSHEYFSRIKGHVMNIPVIHDTFFGTLVELGALGLIVLLSILSLIFRKSLLLFEKLKDREMSLNREIVVMFWGVGIVYIINSLFIDVKYEPVQNVIFYLAAGIMAGLYERRMRCSAL